MLELIGDGKRVKPAAANCWQKLGDNEPNDFPIVPRERFDDDVSMGSKLYSQLLLAVAATEDDGCCTFSFCGCWTAFGLAV